MNSLRPRVNLKEFLETNQMGALYSILVEKFGDDDDEILKIPDHLVESTMIEFGINAIKSKVLMEEFQNKKQKLEEFFDKQMAYVAKCGMDKIQIHVDSEKIVKAIDKKKDTEMDFFGVMLAIDTTDVTQEALKELYEDWKDPGLTSHKGDAFLYPSKKTKSCPELVPTHIAPDIPNPGTGHQNLLNHFGLPAKYCVGYSIMGNVVKLKSGTCNYDKGTYASKQIQRALKGQIAVNIKTLLQTNPSTRRFLSMSGEDLKQTALVMETIPPASVVSVMRALNPSIDNDLTNEAKTRNPLPNSSNYLRFPPGDDSDSEDEKGVWSFRRSNGEFNIMTQSAEVEKAFLSGVETYTYLNKGMNYKVDFATCTQKSLDGGCTRDVKRVIECFECSACKKSFSASKKHVDCSKNEFCKYCFLKHNQQSIEQAMKEFGFTQFFS